MENVYPFVTNDGSIGLYNDAFEDIYHSAYGAYSEACEKFISNTELDNLISSGCDKINVLDICYGIGYNTKSLIQNFSKILNKNYSSKYYNETIYSDNISTPFLYIDAVDMDKNLIMLSPLFKKFSKYNLKKQKLPSEKIRKYLAEAVSGKLYDDWVDIFLAEKIIASGKTDSLYDDFLSRDKIKNFYTYLSRSKLTYMRFLLADRYSHTPLNILQAFVHNIYYHYISTCYKNALKALINKHVDISFNNLDAREFIKSSNKIYDLIFLDAFSPNKCPCLWTYDYIKEIYEHLSPGGRLITYSGAASIRNAMLQSGFYVGKIYNESENRFTGTIAVKNKSFIKYELTGDDLSLVNSKAGIVYRDENLNASNEAILLRREQEVQNSSLMSSSKAVKEGVNV